MVEIAGYRVGDALYSSPKSLVRRGVRLADGRPVVVKIPNTLHPTLRHVAAYERAFRIATSVEVEGLIEHLELVRFRSGYALITDDIGAISVDYILRDGPLPLGVALRIAIEVCACLGRLHARNVIHKDIKPGNIVYNATTGEVRVIDLGISTWLHQENVVGDIGENMEGTPAYMSPEQTGRMNRSVDSRTDLYSLGVSLFEMIAGERPFTANDPIELVHAHIAKAPPRLVDMRRGVPAAVSQIVERLLAKGAEDRYRSAFGVGDDLARCLEAIDADGDVVPFPLGTTDVSARFRIPERLYGRSVEIGQLLQAFTTCADGARALVSVAGYSGIGKTSLVHEVQRPVVERNGWFCSGKFDQFTRDIPYLGWVQALRDLVRQVLMRSSETVAGLRESVLAAVGTNGRVLTTVVPELELLIGPQPEIPSLGLTETQNRFGRVFLNFLRVFARHEHPLVIFLDDLQWADQASILMLEWIASDPHMGHLLLLGGFRDNEVGAGHALRHTLDRLRDEGMPVFSLLLQPLDVLSTTQLFADTVDCSLDLARNAGEMVHRKTGGNPFFVREFLRVLHRDRILAFDAEQRAWDWDEAEIDASDVTDNVVDLMTRRLDLLPTETRDLLATAACIGAEFVIGTLAILTGYRVSEAAQVLLPALDEGVVFPLDPEYKYIHSAGAHGDPRFEADVAHVRYRFQHDRVQQATHNLLLEEEQSERHVHIGRTLLASLPAAEVEARIVDIANHLDRGLHLIVDPDEKARVAALNVKAGAVARRSLAFDAAEVYLDAARTLLGEGGWTTHRDLLVEIHTGLAECALALHRWDALAFHADAIHAHAASLVERTPVWVLQLRAEQSRSRYAEGVDLALTIVRAFGLSLPRHPTEFAVLVDVLRTRVVVGRGAASRFVNHREMQDPEKLCLLAILGAAIPPAYFAEPNLLPILAMAIVRTSVRYGNAAGSGYGYAVYGLVLSGALRLHEAAGEWGRLGLDVSARFSAFDAARASYVDSIFLLQFRATLPATERQLLRTWADCLEVGDEESAVYAAGVAFHYGFLGGSPLASVIERHQESMRQVAESGQLHVRDCFLAWIQLAELLQLPAAEQPSALAGRWFDIRRSLPEFQRADNGVQIAISCIAAGFYEMVCERHEQAEQFFATAEPEKPRILGQVLIPIMDWLRAMNALIAWDASRAPTWTTRRQTLRLARRALRQMRRWSATRPENHDARILLLEAEVLAFSSSSSSDVLAAYSRAHDCAVRRGLLWEEALAFERGAQWARHHEMVEIAGFLYRNARSAFERWGASLRLSTISERFRSLGVIEATALSHSGGLSSVDTADTIDGDIAGEALDMVSLTKAVRNISSEIDIERLIERTMEIVVEAAGANIGLLLLLEDNGLMVRGSHATPDVTFEVPIRVPWDRVEGFPRTVVDYVRRVRDPVVIDDASRADKFGNDAALRLGRIRSLACIPVLLQGTLTGLILLENHHSVGAFTQRRLGFLSAIAAQAAIAIENARLYASAQTALAEQTAATRANSRFVPQEFLQGLGRSSITDVAPGDAVQREMTVLFADIRGFTAIAEDMTPEQTIRFINQYVEHLQPEISREGGFVDSYSGDGILALFDGSAERGVRAAIGMLRALRRFNIARARDGYPSIQIGIGLNSGLLTMGTIGGSERLQCTVIGDTVNLASRVEGLTKRFQVSLLMTENTRSRLPAPDRYPSRLVASVRVAGRERPVQLYEVLDFERNDRAYAPTLEMLPVFNEAASLFFERRFEEAKDRFGRYLRVRPSDRVALDFIQRCDRAIAEGVDDAWDGVEVLVTK